MPFGDHKEDREPRDQGFQLYGSAAVLAKYRLEDFERPMDRVAPIGPEGSELRAARGARLA